MCVSACCGPTDALRWRRLLTATARCPRGKDEALHGESERSAEKASSHTARQYRERGPGCTSKAPAAAAAVQQTQPWLTSRSKGSRGSSKKFSKAKRYGNVTAYFFTLLQLMLCYCVILCTNLHSLLAVWTEQKHLGHATVLCW